MARGNIKGGGGGFDSRELEEFRRQQEEMLAVAQEYGQARQAAWHEEMARMADDWEALARDWQGALEQMSGLAFASFDAIAARGAAAGDFLRQSLTGALGDISAAVEDWGEHFLNTLEKVSLAWLSAGAGGGGEGSGLPFFGGLLSFGGIFHQGGIVEAHQGLVVPPGPLAGEERLVLAQAGEGILPREAMARLGEENFEALRTGRFEASPGRGAPKVDITIQVQSLDGAGAAGINWDRLVKRHILPALQKEAGQSW